MHFMAAPTGCGQVEGGGPRVFGGDGGGGAHPLLLRCLEGALGAGRLLLQ